MAPPVADLAGRHFNSYRTPNEALGADVPNVAVAVVAPDGGSVRGNTIEVTTEITRPTPDTTTYTAGDVVSNDATTTVLGILSGVVNTNGGSGYITGLRLMTDKKSITPRFKIHFFKASNPTVSGDNLPHKELYADGSKRLGFYQMPSMETATDTTNSDMSRSIDMNVPRMPFVCASDSKNIYFLLETLDSFAPSAGQKFKLVVTIEQNN